MNWQRTRVKMCGITRSEDVKGAVSAGADALGFVFYPPSPRSLSLDDAKKIMGEIPPFINKIALFVNEKSDVVERHLKALPIDTLQFHGDESAAYCRAFSKPYLKAVRVREDTDFTSITEAYQDATGLLVDAFDETLYGGSGQRFNWNLLPDQCKLPIVLAGGLNPENVAQAIQQVQPFAVDVSSGIESRKGIKDSIKMTAFMNEVRRVNG